MKKQALSTILIALAVLLLTACSPNQAAETPAAVSAQPPSLIAEGRLMPLNSLDQSFLLPGQVAEVLVQDGEVVEEGQALVRLIEPAETKLALARAQQEVLAATQALDALQTQADLNLAQARLAVILAQEALEDAEARYNSSKTDERQAELDAAAANLKLAEENWTKLDSGGGIDPDLLAAAEARLDTAMAAQGSAQAALDGLTLTASMSGTVIDLSVLPGQQVSAGLPLITVADVSGWVVKTDNLSELDVASLSLGQPVEIVLDALPDTPLTGEVTHINARYEEKRGDITYTVTIRLADTDPRMRWGMTAAVRFNQD